MKEKIELVKELINLAEENELAELNVSFKGMVVEIKKQPGGMMTPIITTPAFNAAMHPASFAPPEQPAAEKEEALAPAAGVPIVSPLAGVFYRSSKPSAPPYVNVGDVVEAGQTLCIIEAMKIMNEIAAEQRGKVLQICGKNGEVANEGDVLFYLEPMK